MPEKLKIFKKQQKVILKHILSTNFGFNVMKKKSGTPSFFTKLINNENVKKNMKEKIFDSELSKIYDPVKTWEVCKKQLKEKNNHIFLWRIFVLTKIFEKF